jgi:UbiD family decarboxylase
LRNIERSGSLGDAIRFLEEHNVRSVELGVYRRDEPLGRVLREAEHSGIGLFRVEGLQYRFAVGLVASRERLYRLLNVTSDIEAYRILWSLMDSQTLRQQEHPTGDFEETFKHIGAGLELIPALRFYERDGGYYTTSSMIVACHGGVCNASIHRVMVSYDLSYAAVRVVPRHLHALLEKAGGSIPVAVVYGVDPVVLLVAATSPPFGVFELSLAARLFRSFKLCSTPTYRLPVPCSASVVVEGVLGPELEWEGPFVDLLDVYDSRRRQPVLHVEAVYVSRRQEPVVHAIVPGGLEHRILMGLPREASIYRAVSHTVPYVRKVRLTLASGMWLHAVISIRKQHDGDGKNAAFAALAAHPSLKHVVVVDEDVDPDDPSQVEWAIATRLQAGRGLVVVPHARGSTLDPSSDDGLTYKIIVDATAPVRDKARYARVEG